MGTSPCLASRGGAEGVLLQSVSRVPAHALPHLLRQFALDVGVGGQVVPKPDEEVARSMEATHHEG